MTPPTCTRASRLICICSTEKRVKAANRPRLVLQMQIKRGVVGRGGGR
jgi:hypothetical protein